MRRPQALADGGAQLEELELALNEVTAAGAGALAAALARQPRLRRLALRENELGDGGALALAPGLAALPALVELDLCQNEARRPQPDPGLGGARGRGGPLPCPARAARACRAGPLPERGAARAAGPLVRSRPPGNCGEHVPHHRQAGKPEMVNRAKSTHVP